MDAKDYHQRVSELFLAACEVPADKRSAWLDQAARGDALMKADVESLLALNTSPAFIDPPALGPGFYAPSPDSLGIDSAAADDLGPVPDRIGGFKIKAVLGRGGMGVVYLAEQDRPQRSVAIKVLRAGATSASALRRFELEAAVLARLQHPGIAQVYEAGTARGQHERVVPFFAMEFIRGVSLTDHANKRNLGTRQRLELIARICDAVQHAHQKGVIHRDLKPGNIVVDELGQPKVLDFGVARVTDGDLQTTTQRTDVGQLIGTVQYMSPEQVGGDPDELDTRTDVYALGVIAYELLAGRPPLDLSKRPIHEAARAIREDDPARLSSIDSTLRGDIENIIAKAMAKDKARRYPSAEALASDIRRYLNDEPISAHPPSTWYQLNKFSRRNKAVVGGVAASFLILLGGVVATLWQAGEANDQANRASERASAATKAEGEAQTQKAAAMHQRDKADLALKRERSLSDLLQSAFVSSDPNEQGSQGVLVTDALEKVIKQLDQGALKESPEIEATLRLRIALIFNGNAQSLRALEMSKRSLEIVRRLHPEDHTDVATHLNGVGQCLQSLGRYSDALDTFQASLAMMQRLFSGDHQSVATALDNISSSLESLGRLDEALEKCQASLKMRQRLFQGDHPDIANSLNSVAECLESLERHAEALPMLQAGLEMQQRLFKGDNSQIATSMNNLAFCLGTLGRSVEGLPMYQASLEMRQRLYKGDHPLVAQSLNNVAFCFASLNRPAEALPGYQAALEMRQRVYQGDHLEVAQSLNNVGMGLRALNRFDEALPMFQAALDMKRRLFPGDHPGVIGGLHNLGSCLVNLGRFEEAIVLATEAAAMAERTLPEPHSLRIKSGKAVADIQAKIRQATTEQTK